MSTYYETWGEDAEWTSTMQHKHFVQQCVIYSTASGFRLTHDRLERILTLLETREPIHQEPQPSRSLLSDIGAREGSDAPQPTSSPAHRQVRVIDDPVCMDVKAQEVLCSVGRARTHALAMWRDAAVGKLLLVMAGRAHNISTWAII